jgi:hypothetical protein
MLKDKKKRGEGREERGGYKNKNKNKNKKN